MSRLFRRSKSAFLSCAECSRLGDLTDILIQSRVEAHFCATILHVSVGLFVVTVTLVYWFVDCEALKIILNDISEENSLKVIMLCDPVS